jgi:hypothetical protein
VSAIWRIAIRDRRGNWKEITEFLHHHIHALRTEKSGKGLWSSGELALMWEVTGLQEVSREQPAPERGWAGCPCCVSYVSRETVSTAKSSQSPLGESRLKQS